jgi:hypothetical protein
MAVGSFPAECLDVVYVLEDTWSQVGVYAWHNPSTIDVGFSRIPTVPPQMLTP